MEELKKITNLDLPTLELLIDEEFYNGLISETVVELEVNLAGLPSDAQSLWQQI